MNKMNKDKVTGDTAGEAVINLIMKSSEYKAKDIRLYCKAKEGHCSEIKVHWKMTGLEQGDEVIK